MCVSQNNYKLFLTLVIGMFFASGCSGHSVKYGANSEGEGMASEEEMTGSVDGVSYGTPRYADGSPVNGGTVNGNSGRGALNNAGTMNSERAGLDGSSFVPGSGSAKESNPDSEARANAYLQEKRSSQEFHGDPSATGSSYGHDYAGASGSGPNHGAVNGFSQGSASQTETNPEMWAKAYLRENGGDLPEYVNPDLDLAQSIGNENFQMMEMRDPNRKLLEISNAVGGAGSRVQDIYFAFDSWSISAEGAKYLEEDAKWLEANQDKSLTIEGHCDQRGTQDYNLVLGKKRAEAAREYLVNLGIQSHRINIVSYGKERPFCQNDNEDCFQDNRRNHMVVRMNQS